MSKGSRPRPFSIPLAEYNDKLDGIFGKKPPREPYVFKPEMLEGEFRIAPDGTREQYTNGKWTKVTI
jgi:hypothetical protein